MASKKAPGVKIIKNLALKTKWLFFLTFGILFLILGLGFIINASHVRLIPQSGFKWILLAVYGTVLMVLGLVSYAYAMAIRAKIEAKKVLKKFATFTVKPKLKVTKLKSPDEKFTEASDED